MDLFIVIIGIVIVMIALFYLLGYFKNETRTVLNPIPYPSWFKYLRISLFVIGISCFIAVAVIAKHPQYNKNYHICVQIK